MKTLEINLSNMGYEAISIDLPLTFKTIEEAYLVLDKEFKKYTNCNLKSNTVHLVGHSTGGLLIRYFINKTIYKEKIGRCVLIAMPNKGSELADISATISKSFVKVFKTLESLNTKNIKNLNIENIRSIDLGAIAGKK